MANLRKGPRKSRPKWSAKLWICRLCSAEKTFKSRSMKVINKIVIIVNRSRQKKLRKRAKTGRNQQQKIGLIWARLQINSK